MPGIPKHANNYQYQAGKAHRAMHRAIRGVINQTLLSKVPAVQASWERVGDDPQKAWPTTGMFHCLTLLFSRGFDRGCRSNSLPVVRYGNATTQATQPPQVSNLGAGRAVRQGVP